MKNNSNSNSDNENNCKFCNCCKKIKVERNEMKCTRCGINIDKKIGTLKMCKTCNNIKSREYYNKKVLPTKVYKMNYTYDKEYTDPNGKVINLILTSETKKCRLCEVQKIFSDFTFVSCVYKGKKALGAECKECNNFIKTNKKQFINKNSLITNDKIETLLNDFLINNTIVTH